MSWSGLRIVDVFEDGFDVDATGTPTGAERWYAVCEVDGVSLAVGGGDDGFKAARGFGDDHDAHGSLSGG